MARNLPLEQRLTTTGELTADGGLNLQDDTSVAWGDAFINGDGVNNEVKIGTNGQNRLVINNSVADFQGNDITGVGELTLSGSSIHRNVTNSSLTLAGGSGSTDGGAVIVYGSTNGSNANDIVFRTGSSTVRGMWDDSEGYWDLRGNDVVGVNSIDVEQLIQLNEITAEPSSPSDGMIAYADGTSWNPGSGEGIYGRVAGSWVKMA